MYTATTSPYETDAARKYDELSDLIEIESCLGTIIHATLTNCSCAWVRAPLYHHLRCETDSIRRQHTSFALCLTLWHQTRTRPLVSCIVCMWRRFVRLFARSIRQFSVSLYIIIQLPLRFPYLFRSPLSLVYFLASILSSFVKKSRKVNPIILHRTEYCH